MKVIKQKVEKAWTTGKKLFAIACVWGLIFSVVTIGGLRAAFDYDDTLVDSTASYNKAFNSGVIPFTGQFWTILNESYDLEKPKKLTNLLAWTLRICGFRITILAKRSSEGGEPLRKEWRHLASHFVFVPNSSAKHIQLSQGNHVLYFGDSDSTIREGRLARVFTLRVKRHSNSSYKEDYHPGSLSEIVLPFSEY